jgi:hypothetical protein
MVAATFLHTITVTILVQMVVLFLNVADNWQDSSSCFFP